MLLAGASEATVYHVSPTGNDVASGTTLATAWHFIQRACHVAARGDTTYIHGSAPGVLTTYLIRRSVPVGEVPTAPISPSTDRFASALATLNSGTQTQPIVFKVWPGDSVNIKYDPGETGRGPLAGAYLKNYIVWDGFVFTETVVNNQSDTGPIVWAGDKGDSTGGNLIPPTYVKGGALKNCDIRATQILVNDNHNALRIEYVDSLYVGNDLMRGIGSYNGSSANHNHCIIMTYAMIRSTIEHNNIGYANAGVFIKGGPQNNDTNIVRFNDIHHCKESVRLSFAMNQNIYQNIIHDGFDWSGSGPTEVFGFAVAEECLGGGGACVGSFLNPTPGMVANRNYYNNLIYNVYEAINMPGFDDRITGTGMDFRNNIIYTSGRLFGLGGFHAPNNETMLNDISSSNYNCFFPDGTFRYLGANLTLVNWRSQTGLDANSLAQDPQMVNPAAGDYHLKITSPCLTVAPDWGDLDGDSNTSELINIGPYQTGNEIIGIVPTSSVIVNPTNSYFVPQAGTTLSPIEGPSAIAFATTCPNNDLLANNARIKIVLRNSSNAPLVGVAAADIYASLNGGPVSQGFNGSGDDTLMASSAWQPLAGCPNTRRIIADAATDAAGVTYITWKGSTPGQPGVATRDRNRKWGLFAGDIPVYALGIQLQGRITSASPNGTYTAHVKNVDVFDPETLNQGETVNAFDFNIVNANFSASHAYRYDLDFNNNGVVDINDLNLLKVHMRHTCNYPNAN
jgi:hypothetical protein